ncbi:MAG: Ni/Fe hydrogenase subunit alpha [Deferrisomatales bacterium]
MRIQVEHVTRIEGHAHLVVDAARGDLRECRLEVVESPRFFEMLLRGRPSADVAPLAARICGVCSHSHTLASLAATEAALGVRVSPQTRRLRRLLACGEILQSHLLHLYFMAAPDYLGIKSLLPPAPTGMLPLAKSRRDLVSRALRMKKLANDLCRVVGGRAVHPVTPCVGGFATVPEAGALLELRRRLVGSFGDLEATVELFGSFSVPSFTRATRCQCLVEEPGYPLMGEWIACSDGARVPVADYRSFIEEYTVAHSTAKFARSAGAAYQVGPLARVKNAFSALSPMARKVARALGLDPDTANPYDNVYARLVEVVHWVEAAIGWIDAVLAAGLAPEPPAAPTRAGGWGAAAVEAPRGTLIHAYAYDGDGRLEQADCVIPTAQNLANIEADLAALVATLAGQPREEVTRRLEMLLRAYDPCISCSTHTLQVEFV